MNIAPDTTKQVMSEVKGKLKEELSYGDYKKLWKALFYGMKSK